MSETSFRELVAGYIHATDEQERARRICLEVESWSPEDYELAPQGMTTEEAAAQLAKVAEAKRAAFARLRTATGIPDPLPEWDERSWFPPDSRG